MRQLNNGQLLGFLSTTPSPKISRTAQWMITPCHLAGEAPTFGLDQTVVRLGRNLGSALEEVVDSVADLNDGLDG